MKLNRIVNRAVLMTHCYLIKMHQLMAGDKPALLSQFVFVFYASTLFGIYYIINTILVAAFGYYDSSDTVLITLFVSYFIVFNLFIDRRITRLARHVKIVQISKVKIVINVLLLYFAIFAITLCIVEIRYSLFPRVPEIETKIANCSTLNVTEVDANELPMSETIFSE